MYRLWYIVWYSSGAFLFLLWRMLMSCLLLQKEMSYRENGIDFRSISHLLLVSSRNILLNRPLTLIMPSSSSSSLPLQRRRDMETISSRLLSVVWLPVNKRKSRPKVSVKERERQGKRTYKAKEKMHVEKSSPTMMRKRDCVLDVQNWLFDCVRLVEEFPSYSVISSLFPFRCVSVEVECLRV